MRGCLFLCHVVVLVTVQYECIPKAILSTDLICQAKSGMGKTAVFVLAILQQLEAPCEGCHAIVIAHTKELAFYLCSEFQRFSKHLPFVKSYVFYGGVPLDDHITKLREEQPTIAIGTPGRMAQLVREELLKLGNVRFFVLDECDYALLALGACLSMLRFSVV